jgi:arginase
MNAHAVSTVARATAERVASALTSDEAVLVLGGDCTVELGTVAGALRDTQSIGVVYIDLDTDLNTPQSTPDGALDWMGVAHMLGLKGTLPELATLGPRVPMLRPEQVLFFANDNIEPFERQVIDELGIAEVRLADVVADPSGAAEAVASGWARQFDRLLVHLDVDVLDYIDMPLAENNRRNVGLRFDQLMASLRPLLRAPNWTTLTVCELNPDHGESDGSTLRSFADALADALAASPRWQRS